jgi:hypothetical protein
MKEGKSLIKNRSNIWTTEDQFIAEQIGILHSFLSKLSKFVPPRASTSFFICDFFFLLKLEPPTPNFQIFISPRDFLNQLLIFVKTFDCFLSKQFYRFLGIPEF